MHADDSNGKDRRRGGGEAGQTLTEVSFVMALVAAICIVFLVLLGTPIVGYFQAMVNGFA